MENPVAGGAVSVPIKEALRGTKGWVKLVGVLLFIGAALTILGALAMIVGAGMGGLSGTKQGSVPIALMVGMCALYITIAAIYIFLGMYLFNYSNAIGRLLVDDQVATLEVALQSQQKFWKLAGIMALVMLVISLIGIVAAIAIPMMMSR